MILCVEDELNICELEVYTLNSVGLEACGVSCSKELFEALETSIPELIILDIMLPDEDGLSILAKLKQNEAYKDIPVIMATAKGAEYDKVKGLDLGADDYLAKPFGMMEMVARVRAVLRRCQKNNSDRAESVYSIEGLKLDQELHEVWVDGERLALTLKEYELLKLLLLNPRKVFTREELLNSIWGYDFYGETRTVDVHIRTLRQKLGRLENIIGTVRGVGYRLDKK